jgi:hypothetical protein
MSRKGPSAHCLVIFCGVWPIVDVSRQTEK